MDPTKALNVGVAAHITAASPEGPRYALALSTDERRHADNAIWLCQTCAKLVDNDPARFTSQLLREWKRVAEAEALAEIGKSNASTSGRGELPSPFPGPPLCFGRDSEIGTLLRAVLEPAPQPIPILGPPGIGKSTIAIAAAHDPDVVRRFEERRYFVRCDAANNGGQLIALIAQALGLEPGANLKVRVFDELKSGALLILDNAETPWEADAVGTEDVISSLSAIPSIALVVSLRGTQRPLGVRWREPVLLQPLDSAATRATFLAIAGSRHRDDPCLDRLVGVLDGVPLAIVLLAHLVEGEPSLANIWEVWQRRRTDLLQRPGPPSRQTSLAVSLEASIRGARMTDPARRLLSILALLPLGIAHDGLNVMLPDIGTEAAATLRRVGLAFDQGARLLALAPVREHVRGVYPAWPVDVKAARDHFAELARTLGRQVGRLGGAEAARQLAVELPNLEALIVIGLEGSDPIPSVQTTLELADFAQFSGLGTTEVLERARTVARARSEALLEAACSECIGDIKLMRSDLAAAEQLYEEGLRLYRAAGSRLGVANCLKGLGDVALRQWVLEGAQARYREALEIYRELPDLNGVLNSLRELGEIALRRGNYEAAQRYYDEVLEKCRASDDILGQANCLSKLGELASERSASESAKAPLWEEALRLYRAAGDRLGEANCMFNLATLISSYDPMAAQSEYLAAIRLYRVVGDVLGEANSARMMGQVIEKSGNQAVARARYREALGLYERIKDPYGKGLAHRDLARLAQDADERRGHTKAAWEAWSQTGRGDLLQQLRGEFGDATT